MTYPLLLHDLVIDLATGEHQINPIQDPEIISPVDYGWKKYHEHIHMTGDRAPEMLTFGGGPLTGSRIPGTRRMVITSYSPLWDGFYISSMGYYWPSPITAIAISTRPYRFSSGS